jgi:hypothetical protein
LRPSIVHSAVRREVQIALLDAYERLGAVTLAADEVGIDRSDHYDWLEKDPVYADMWADAQEGLTQRMEAAAVERATTGAKRGVWFQGKRVGEEPWYSDNLLMFLLKARRRAVYGDVQAITGADGGPLQVQAVRPDALSRLTAAQLDALAALNGIPVAGLLGAPGAPAGPVVDAEVAPGPAPAEVEPFDPAF